MRRYNVYFRLRFGFAKLIKMYFFVVWEKILAIFYIVILICICVLLIHKGDFIVYELLNGGNEDFMFFF